MLNYLLRARNRKNRGFTIIELVIVIAIIGILSAVLIPNFSNVVSNADVTAAAANLASVNKIAATANVNKGNGSMLDVTAAVVTNFGRETAAKSLKNAVYSSETHTFTELANVKTENKEAPDRTLYYPVYGTSDAEVIACLQGYDFIDYIAGTNTLSKGISKKIGNVTMADKTGKFTEIYVVNGSLALHSDVELTDALFIFLDGASLETNGNAFKCHSVAFVDTSADGKAPVTFNVYGGNVLPEYSFGVLNVKNFYKADNTINWDATPEFAETTGITLNFGGTLYLNTPDYSGIYLNVDSACANVAGVITLPENGVFFLDGDSKLVVEDGGTILPAQSQAQDMSDQVSTVSISLKSGTDNVTVVLNEGSFVSMTNNGEHSIAFDGVPMGNGVTKSSVSPLTASVAANYLTQITQAIIAAGGNMNAAMAIVEKVGNAMVSTAASVSATLGASNAATAQAIISSADLTNVVSAVNSMKTNVVSTALTTTANAASAAVATAVGTVTVSTATPGAIGGGVSVVSQMNAYSTCDTSWYVGHESDSTYTLTKPEELYGLSTLVFNGVTSFYGKTIRLGNDIDLDAYKPWLPIGNGQYGFRGVFDGNGKTIKNMHIDVNKSWIMLSMSGKGFNNTSYRTALEGTAFGYQNGDKYSVGFIGVLENGGELKNVTFSNCNVSFDYNWNSYAAVAVGAIRATGEDYSYNANGYSNAGKVITGFENGIAVYGAEANASASYKAGGQKWNGDTYEAQQNSRLSGTQSASTSYRDRAFDGWTTKVTNVTVDDTCSVYATGRCGGVVAVASGAYYNNSGYNEGRATNDTQSIFASWGNVVISGCSNGADVTHVPTQAAYMEGGGVLGYLNVAKNLKVDVSNCSNSGDIKAGTAGGVVGSFNGAPYATINVGSCSNTGNISVADTNRAGVKLHTSTSAAQIYNTKAGTVGA